MADYDTITDLYRISGVRNIGSSYTFPRVRVARKVKRRPGEEEESMSEEETGSSKSSEGKGKGIDIEV